MREYKIIIKEEKLPEKVYCNRCGREIKIIHPECKDNYLSVDKRWGYGSKMDGEEHSFDLCEECYALMISEFKISPRKRD